MNDDNRNGFFALFLWLFDDACRKNFDGAMKP